MKHLRLSSELSAKAANGLRGVLLTERDFTLLVQEEMAVYDKHGVVVAVLVKDVIPAETLAQVLPHLLTLRGDLTNRATVVGKGAQMARIRKDGLPSARKSVPKAVLLAKGGKGDQLGYFDYDHAQNCRETNWTRKNPEALAGCAALISKVNHVYKKTLPNHHARQMTEVDAIQPGLKIPGTAFSTLTVNLNNRCAAHTDRGDVREGMGCLTTHGEFQGGYFIMPRYSVAFDLKPGDVLLANVHALHGNAAMAGQRVSVVYYARERLNLCSQV